MEHNLQTISDYFQWASQSLASAQIENPHLETILLMSSALQTDKVKIYSCPYQILNPEEILKLNSLIARRRKKEPVAYILGYKEFFSLQFYVDPHVLIPRPETEILIETAVYYNPVNKSILDLCTGSGNIGITLKKVCATARVSCSDISPEALALAGKNAGRLLGEHDIKFIQSDVFKNIHDQYDIIISNPPYIPSAELDDLIEDVKDFEPRSALDGGPDGMLFYEKIILEAPFFLHPQGLLLLEINPGLKEQILQLIGNSLFNLIELKKDYSGLDRVLVLRYEK